MTRTWTFSNVGLTENVHAPAERLAIADMEGVMNLLSDVLQHVVQTISLPSEWMYVDCCVICRGVVGAR